MIYNFTIIRHFYFYFNDFIDYIFDYKYILNLYICITNVLT